MIKQIVYQIHFPKVPKELYTATRFDARFYHNSTGYYFEIYVNDKLFYKQGTLETEELMYSIADEFMANFNAIRKTELSWEPGKNEPEVIYRYLDTSQNINLSIDYSTFEKIAAKLFDTPIKDVDHDARFVVKLKQAVANNDKVFFHMKDVNGEIYVHKTDALNIVIRFDPTGIMYVTIGAKHLEIGDVYFSPEEAKLGKK